jgi:hypothetical protein
MSGEFHDGYIEGYKAATGHVIGIIDERIKDLSNKVLAMEAAFAEADQNYRKRISDLEQRVYFKAPKRRPVKKASTRKRSKGS